MLSRAVFFLFLLLGFAACKVNHLAQVEPQAYSMSAETTIPDPKTDALIAPYREQLSAEMDEQIGYAAIELVKAQPESTLGNWMTDLLEEEARLITGKEIAFALQNYGGIRIPSIPSGPVTVGKVYELMPFDNMLVIIELSGAAIETMVQRMAEKGGVPISSGLRYRINENGKAVAIEVQGKELNKNASYLIALPDYVANGGDKLVPDLNAARIETGLLIRDAIIQHIRKQTAAGNQLQSELDQRVQIQTN